MYPQTIFKEATQDRIATRDRIVSAYIVSNVDILLLIVRHGFQYLEILVLLEQIQEMVINEPFYIFLANKDHFIS